MIKQNIKSVLHKYNLTLLYSLVILLIVGIILLFTRVSTNSINKYDEIADLSAKKLSLLIDMRKNADYIQIQLFKHALDTSITEMKDAEKKIIPADINNDIVYNEYKKLIKDTRENDLYNKLIITRNANKESRNKLIEIDYANGADIRESIHYQQTVQQKKYEDYQAAITALSNYLVNEINQKVQYVDLIIYNSKIVINSLLVFLLMMLIGLGFIIKNTLKKLRTKNVELYNSKNSLEYQTLYAESILLAAPDGIIGIDKTGIIVIFNKQAEHIFGYSKEEAIGQSLSLLLPDQFIKDHPEHVANYFKNPGDRPITNRLSELFAKRKNGEVFPSEITLSFIDTKNNKIAIAGLRDITKRKATEKKLQQLADINKYSKAMVGISTIDRKVIYMNDSFKNALGLNHDTEINDLSTYSVYPDPVKLKMQVIFKEVFEKGMWSGENEIISQDGRIIPVLQNIILHRDAQGIPEFTSSTMVDITEQKNKEKELNKINKLYDVLSKATRILLNVTSKEDLYQQICNLIVEIGSLRLSWIGEFNTETKIVEPKGLSGDAEKYLEGIIINVDIPYEQMGPTATCITDGKYQIHNDFYNSEKTKPWQDKAKQFMLEGSAVFPMKVNNKTIGTLNVYSAHKDYFQEEEIALLEEIAAIVSLGLTKIEEEKEKKFIETKRQQLSEIIEHNVGLVSMSDMNNNFVYINESGRKGLGLRMEDDVSAINVFDIMTPSSQEIAINTIIPALETKGIWQGEIALKTSNNNIINGFLVSIQHKDDKGISTHRSNTVIDLNELKKSQQETTKLAGIIKNSNALIGIANPDFTVNYMNESMRVKYGFGLEEDVSSLNITALIPPHTLKIYNEFAFPALIKEGKWDGEVEWMHRDGTLFTVAMVNEVHKNKDGEIDYISTNAIDITDIKKKDNELKQLSNIIKQSNAYVWISSLDAHFVYLNNTAKEALEIQEDEDITQIKVYDFHSETSKEKLEKIGKDISEKGVWTGEAEMKSKSGKIIPTLQVVMMHYDKNGEPEFYSSTAIDITETKKKEKELKQLADIIEKSNAYIGISGLDNQFIYLNNTVKEAFEIAPEEDITKMNVFDFHSKASKEKLENIGKELLDKGVWTGETEMISKSGKIIPTLQVVMMHFDKKGEPECYSTTAIDISKIKEKEKESKKLIEVLEHSTAFVLIADMDKKITFLNEPFKKALGIAPDEDISTIQISEFSSENSKGLLPETLQTVLKKGFWVGESEVKARSGRIIPIFQEIALHYDDHGAPEFMSTTSIDISEIKNKTKELEKLSGIIEHSTSYAGIANIKDASILYCNNSMKKALGMEDSEDFSKYKLHDFLTPESVKYTNEVAFKEVMENGLWQGQTIWKNKEGKIIPVIQSIMLHRNENGEPEYASTTAIDISELKQREAELEKFTIDLRELYNNLQNIKEEERKTIAKEIHDELGQNLTALKLNVAWISKHIDGDKVMIQERLQILDGVTSETVNTSRRLYNNLYPQMLESVGVAGAILWHTNSYKATTGIDIEYNTNIAENNESRITQPIGLALFRIYQESFTNILRYAKPNLVVVNLIIKDNLISMCIEDDGIGFVIKDVDTKLHHGLLGMRERANALNGKLTIESVLGKGTKTIVEIPL